MALDLPLRPVLPVLPVLLDALRLIRDARIALTVPLVEGSLFPGLAVRPGTTLRVSVQVQDGVLLLPHAQVELLPALDGPLFTQVKGLTFDDAGRLTVRIGGFPDLKVGPAIPMKVSDLADWLSEGLPERVGVRLFGMKLLRVETETVAQLAPEVRSLLFNPTQPGAPRFDQLRMSVTDVDLVEGTLLFGARGRVRVGSEAGGAIEVEGGELRLAADVHYCDLQLHGGEWSLEDGAGRALLEVTARYDCPEPELDVQLTRAQLRAGRTKVCPRPGEHLSATHFSTEGAHFEVKLRGNTAPILQAALPRSEGALESGRVSLRFGDEDLVVELGPSSWRGAVSLGRSSFKLEGEVRVNGRIPELRPSAGAVALDVYDCELEGDAEVEVSFAQEAGQGVLLRGRGLTARTRIRHASAAAWGNRLTVDLADDASSAELDVEELALRLDGHLRVLGEGELQVRIHHMHAGEARGQLAGEDARLQGRAKVSLDTRSGLKLGCGDMRLKAPHWSMRAQLPRGGALQLDGRCELVLDDAVVDATREGFVMDGLECAAVRGDIDRGWMGLPDGKRVRLRKGSAFSAKLDEGRLGTDRGAKLRGALRLELHFEADEDLLAATGLFGIELGELCADNHHLTVDLDALTLGPSGDFALENARLGLRSDVGSVSGRLPVEDLPVI